jgi:hypothetical protein
LRLLHRPIAWRGINRTRHVTFFPERRLPYPPGGQYINHNPAWRRRPRKPYLTCFTSGPRRGTTNPRIPRCDWPADPARDSGSHHLRVFDKNSK